MRSLLLLASSARLRRRVSIDRLASARGALLSSSPAEESGERAGFGENERDEDDGAPIASPPSQTRATIVAPATSTAQAAAVAVLRVSGPHADAVLRGLLPRGQPLPEPRVATLVKLLRKEGRRGRNHQPPPPPPPPPRLLDRALVLRFPGPRSYTGEDVVELHVHGGTAVVSAVMEAALEVGSSAPGEEEGCGGAGGACPFAVRVAEPGEFTRRAFESGKIDLTAAEGIADLVAAADDASAASAAALADGRLRGAARKWRERAVELLAAAEAAAEFEDDPAAMTLVDEESATTSVASGVSWGASLLADALDDALAAAAASRTGSSSSSTSPRVALLGLPNGKVLAAARADEDGARDRDWGARDDQGRAGGDGGAPKEERRRETVLFFFEFIVLFAPHRRRLRHRRGPRFSAKPWKISSSPSAAAAAAASERRGSGGRAQGARGRGRGERRGARRRRRETRAEEFCSFFLER